MDRSTPASDQHPTPLATPQPAAADKRWRGARGWALSSGIHFLLLALLTYAITAVHPHDEDAVPRIPTRTMPQVSTPVPPPDRKPQPPTPPSEVPPVEQVTETSTKPDDRDLAVPVVTDDPATTPDVATEAPSETPSDDATSNAFSLTMAAIGSGASGSRPSGIGPRSDKAGPPGTGHPKPPRQTVRAVDAALRWFVRHQDADGGWKVLTYPNQCQDTGPRCEPGTAHTGREGDVACSALALLCFLGYGHDGVTPTQYRKVVARGLTWLAAQQDPDGTFGARNYEHAVAVMALSDAMAVASGKLDQLKPAVQRGVDVILARQNPGPGGTLPSGWDYVRPNAHRDDSSVTGWNVMALKSAHMAGLKIGQGLQGAKAWVERAWETANPQRNALSTGDESSFPYVCDQTAGTSDRDHLAGLGAACAAFLGFKRGEVLLESLANRVVAKDLPRLRRWPCNAYQLYYDTMAMFQVTSGGRNPDPRWTAWNQPITDMLIGGQRQDGDCFNGSWDFANAEFPGRETGRLLSTALCCLSLETQERFQVATMR